MSLEVKAKPYYNLKPHLEDAYRVFQAVWRQNEEQYTNWCIRNRLDLDEVYFLFGLGVYLHDIGKANEEWQEYLLREDQKRTRVSHPLLSFAVLWEIFQQWDMKFLDKPLYRAVLTSVLAHHGMLHDKKYESVSHMKPFQLSPEIVNPIISSFFASHPQKTFAPFQPNQLYWKGPELVERVKKLRRSIYNSKLKPKDRYLQKALHTFALSLVCLADNVSSAVAEYKYNNGALREDQCVVDEFTIASQELTKSWLPVLSLPEVESPIYLSPNDLQRKVLQKISPYMVVRAGCGEGKTGVALWFARHWIQEKRANRVIFTLPTRFTINSMYQDLISKKYDFPKELVEMYHSEAAYFLTSEDELDDEDQPEESAFCSVEDRVFRSNFFQPVVTITTVDHLLYSLLHAHKYADRAFGNLLQSVVIFDELHYYQPYTLNKIVECLKLLKRYEIPHLLMSATLPDSFLDQIKEKIPYVVVESEGKDEKGNVKNPFVIEKAKSPLLDSEEGLNEEALEMIDQYIHLRQMIVVNQVERAKQIAKILMARYPDHNVVCYHSEFTALDRKEKERCIKALFKPKNQRTDEERKVLLNNGYQDNDAVILVATQICELSLDISCDIQYTELAPIDALSQRGGRLHRKGVFSNSSNCSCSQCEDLKNKHDEEFVYRQIVFPLDIENKNAGYPYVNSQDWIGKKENILIRSWEILGREYTFSNVQKWVNQLYPDFRDLYDDQMVRYIEEDIVFGKRPIDRFGREGREESEGSFQVRLSEYRTVDVIPADFQDEVLSFLAELKEGRISGKDRSKIFDQLRNYYVPIKEYRYYQLKDQKKLEPIEPIKGIQLLIANIPYDSTGIGFDFQADQHKNTLIG